MTLIGEFLRLVVPWRQAFAQDRSFLRFLAVLLGLVGAPGRRTVTGSIRYRDRGQQEWSADYLVFSRAEWDVGVIMSKVFEAGVRQLDELGPGLPVVLAMDDTSVKKSSRVIDSARWMRDPLSPPFHMNLKYGLRYLHTALLLPLHVEGFDPRAISVGFELAPSTRKPGKKASEEDLRTFRERRKQENLSQRALTTIKARRRQLDDMGMKHRRLLMVGDGSYTNRIVLRGLPERVEYIGRTRKNLAIFRPAPPGSRKVYGERLPTPENLRTDAKIPYRTAEFHIGGRRREIRYKEISDVLWRSATGRKPLRLLILAPIPYMAPAGGRKRKNYNDPAYLLTTDLTTPAVELIQNYLDRWQIEVVHRDLKTGLGVGQAQVWSPASVERLNTALVATWAMLTLAALRAFGPRRTADFGTLPCWRNDIRPNHRASQEDIVQLVRKEIGEIRSGSRPMPTPHSPVPLTTRARTMLVATPP